MVFQQGDRGDLFYIVLAGSCAVLAGAGQTKQQLLALVRQGDSFGELALIANVPRAASIMCREECSFAVLAREDYQSVLASVQDRALLERVELIRRHPTFALWKKETVMRLSYFFKSRITRKMQVLFVSNQPVSELFLIKEGQFSLTKNILVYPRGPTKKPIRKDILVTTVHPGELLGASQAIEGRTYDYTCTCGSNIGEALVISRKNFVNFMVFEGKSENLLAVEKDKEGYMQKQVAATLQTKAPKVISPITEDFMGKRLVRRPSSLIKRTNSTEFLSPYREESGKTLIKPMQRARNAIKARTRLEKGLSQSLSLPHVLHGRGD